MIFLSRCDSLIFDLDGTLWNASESTARGWNRTLKNLKLPQSVTADSIRSVSGLPFDQCVESLFPGLPQSYSNLATDLDLAEKEEILRHGGELYPGVLELIPQLSKKYRLFIVSNCQEWYLKSFLEHSKLESHFEDTLCFGQTNLSKTENIRELVSKNNLQKPIYIGDTQWDQHAAFYAGVKFIFARYGFGSVDINRCPSVSSFIELGKWMMSPQGDTPQVDVRRLTSADFPEAQRFYQSVNYLQPLDPKSLFYGAFHKSEMIGLVRLAQENEIWILRGMQVRASYQFLGIGTQLIKALESDILSSECYCLPHGWLEKFYSKIGFRNVQFDESIPDFLVQRLAVYHKKYPDMIVMKREMK